MSCTECVALSDRELEMNTKLCCCAVKGKSHFFICYFVFTHASLEFLWFSLDSTSGLKITADYGTMSGQDDYLSGQNLGLVVI